MTTRIAPVDDSVLGERRDSPGLLLALLGSEAMRTLRRAHLKDGLSPQQFHLLALLHDRGPMAQGELGATVGTDASVLITRLNPLEASGFISRERDETDRRRHLVVLTEAGAKKLKASARAQQGAEDSILAALDDGQRLELQTLLLAVRDSRPTDEPTPCKEDS